MVERIAWTLVILGLVFVGCSFLYGLFSGMVGH